MDYLSCSDNLLTSVVRERMGVLVKPAELAGRADFRVGPLLVSPARRRVEGPAGHTQIEPLIMQVFLKLLDAAGQVVTRDTLFDAGWGGAIVGDDSLNRVINRVRKIDAEIGPGVFKVETVPRTGYRLIGNFNSDAGSSAGVTSSAFVSRRAVLASGAAAAAGIAGFSFWLSQSRDEEFKALLSRGEEALNYSDPAVDPGEYFKEALALRSDSARALGLHAYALSSKATRPNAKEAGRTLQEATNFARAALLVDPAEPNARLALVLAQQSTLDLGGTEDRLREILGTAPSNINVMRNLWNLLQCVGRSREALALVERSLAVAPLAAGGHFPKAQLLWITGRTAEADRVIDKALQYWPEHRYVRFARFTILASTGRARAALAMLDKRDTRPQVFSPESVSLWRTSLIALDGGSPAMITAARKANFDSAISNLALSSQAVMSLCALGDIDSAFRITNALFAVSGGQSPRSNLAGSSAAWRFAPWMFVPPTAPMRADDRFDVLCDGIGLTDYWSKKRITPDFRLANV